MSRAGARRRSYRLFGGNSLPTKRMAADRPTNHPVQALVADDDRVTAEILSRTLKRWEFDVTVVGDGTKAWDYLRGATAPTLAVLDWMMPERISAVTRSSS